METNPKKLGFYDQAELLRNVEGALQDYYSGLSTDSREIQLNKITYGPETYDPDDWTGIKDALLNKKTIAKPIYGEFELKDTETGKVIDRMKKKIGDLPVLTRHNSYIVNGTPYNVPLQLRMKPGAYSRETEVGENEVYSNVAKGRSFRTMLDPENKKLTLRVGTTNLPLIPLLRELGVSEGRIIGAVGGEVYESNKNHDPKVIDNAYRAFVGRGKDTDADDKRKTILNSFTDTVLDEDVTYKVLGTPHGMVSPEYILDTAKEVIAVTKGEKEESNRDDIEYKEVFTIMDHLPDNIRRRSKVDQNGLFRIKRRMNQKDKLSEILDRPPSAAAITDYFSKSTLSRYASQLNPVAMTSGAYLTTLLGEGGISSSESVPSSSSDPQDSHYGFLDMLHTPESASGGITLNVTAGTKREGKKLVIEVINVLNGRREKVSNDRLSEYVIAMPKEFTEKNGKWLPANEKVRALKNGKMSEVRPYEVRYMHASPAGLYDLSSNTIPFMSNTQGNRLLTGSKMIEQAVPLKDPDVPLVEVTVDGKSILQDLGKNYSTRTQIDGTIEDVQKGVITVRGNDGKLHRHVVPDNMPLTQKSFIDAVPRVKIGDKVRTGQLIADSNFTKDGKIALGKNLNVAYVPWRGRNYEDAVVLTESGAKKLQSVHMFEEELIDDGETIASGIDRFMAYSPKALKKEDVSKYDERGVIKPGTKVGKGDILVAALRINKPTGRDLFVDRLRKSKARPFKDASIKWEYDREGIVSDVVSGPSGMRVFVKTDDPMRVGDKLVGRYGNKGIVSEIIPDEDAPRTSTGEIIDLLIDPLSVVPRINLGQTLETAAAKIADIKKKQFTLENYDGKVYRDILLDVMKKDKINEKEDIVDPVTGNRIPNIFTGKQYMYKLHHEADLKASGRGIDGPYTQDEQPARGGDRGAQSIDRLTANVLLAHDARSFLRDAMSVKSSRNDEYWDAIQHNRIPPAPKVPYEWEKFRAHLQGMGINTVQKGSELELTPLTDRDVKALSAGTIDNPYRMILGKGVTATPDKDGLFGEAVGGIRGNVFNHIDLKTTVPSPAYKKAIATLLGIKEKEYDEEVTGRSKK